MKPNIHKKKRTLTPGAVTHLLTHEWHLPVHSGKRRHQTLEALGLSNLEVNLILHTVEWRYQCDIAVAEIPLQTTLKEFMQLLAGPRKGLDILSH
jgi:hypothetical protein